jgi:hypothetical protein
MLSGASSVSRGGKLPTTGVKGQEDLSATNTAVFFFFVLVM